MIDKRQGVYVWEFPIRFTHWINFLCIILLMVTGFYIGRPFIHAYSSEQYIMGWVRLIHFIAAYTFMMSMIIRIYWAFLGNKYASFKVSLTLSATRPLLDSHTCLYS
jgi:Ni/Fe-hydrogenase 1 B-type cytochrome subunit